MSDSFVQRTCVCYRQMWQYTTFTSVNTDGKESALSLTSPTECKSRNCGSILHVNKRFINHFSEVSNPTLGTTQPPFQRPPADSPPVRPNVKLTIHPQLVSRLRMRAAVGPFPLKPSRCARRYFHPYLFILLFSKRKYKFSYLPTKGRYTSKQ
jgi:hypothetical protein